MRPIEYADRTVLHPARVEMNSDGKHVLDDRSWRLHMCHTRLLGPRAVAGDLGSCARGDGEILVPDHFPVRVGRLVEQQCAHGETLDAKDNGREPTNRSGPGERLDLGEIEQVARATTPIAREWGNRVTK